MNIKKIIKEEMDDFDWVSNTSPYESFSVYYSVNDLGGLLDTQKKLATSGIVGLRDYQINYFKEVSTNRPIIGFLHVINKKKTYFFLPIVDEEDYNKITYDMSVIFNSIHYGGVFKPHEL